MDGPAQLIELIHANIFPPTSLILQTVQKATELFAAEPNLLQIDSPVTIVGDLHGQLFDLLEIFTIAGPPPTTRYLLLGDYVDRGQHSIETISLLLALKCMHPRSFHMIRGNHEDAKICSNYGFSTEITAKISDFPREIWRAMIDCFETMPLAAAIKSGDYTTFAVHAGLSPSLFSMSQINAIPRFSEFPESQQCIINDLLWSDPSIDISTFEKSSRGAGCGFGALVAKKFCYENDLQHIFRSHQMQNDGYMIYFNDLLSTVWSAPRYTNKQNLAAIVKMGQNGVREYIVFECSVDFDGRAEIGNMLNPGAMGKW
ncbi:Serine/threonine-protein phosphatase [Spironucleus salmonicida]|uniref:Serine/threonine-protein phosphatase n=1 Tax=Spironucleus salmonicida TaxID=348837 RepID=V6LJK8_9EUKA|nr:Serine/threonine-protein phosphatase [Spironucleus salmonicida]|eukprot:EST44707.1 Serine/threonine-protein phosphatase [Spironucleus salmonicida]